MSDPATVLRELARVWNSQDRDGVAALFAGDAVFRDMAFGVERSGVAEIREMMDETWRGIADLHTELTRIVADGGWVASESRQLPRATGGANGVIVAAPRMRTVR